MSRPVDLAAAPLTEFLDNPDLWPAGKQRMAAHVGRDGLSAFSSHSEYVRRTEVTMCDSSQRIGLSVWLGKGIDLQVDRRAIELQSRSTLVSILDGAPWRGIFQGASHHVGLLLEPAAMEQLAGAAATELFKQVQDKGGIYALPSDAATMRAAYELDTVLMTPSSALLREAKSLELLARMLDAEQTPGICAREKRQVHLARERLLQDPANPPTIAELAKASGLNTLKLKRGFKSVFGLPIHAYYQQERMRLAWSLLERGQMSVSEVGAYLGYTNMSHFGAAFRRVHAVLPSELRRTQRTR